MPSAIRVDRRWVGEGFPCYIVAEIGINHNGDEETLMRLIDLAADAGCDAVKFQKRTIEKVYTPGELNRPRQSPFGDRNIDLKMGLELSRETYERINQRLRGTDLHWFASPWDEESVGFLMRFHVPVFKVPGALVTDTELLGAIARTGQPVFLSTGMSNLDEIDAAVRQLGPQPYMLMQCTSAYPCRDDQLHLRVMQQLRKRYDVPVGYSGHELGIATTVAAVAMGACVVERHITLDRSMWGSDQSASLEPQGLRRLVRDIRTVESAMGVGDKRRLSCEMDSYYKLRREAIRG